MTANDYAVLGDDDFDIFVLGAHAHGCLLVYLFHFVYISCTSLQDEEVVFKCLP